ncbi:MAG TPA: hypothetical protein VM869_31445 [Enhygromyxa sp.]|nr:hypothetical protein [Enhygromyxa sp.]
MSISISMPVRIPIPVTVGVPVPLRVLGWRIELGIATGKDGQ